MCELQSMVNSSFRLSEIPVDVAPCDHIASLLRKAGLNMKAAQQLVSNELEITPVTRLKGFRELLEGRYSESGGWIEASDESKSVGAKLSAFLKWDGVTGNAPHALTPEEKDALLVKSTDVTVRSGFFERVATYVKDKHELQAVFKVFRPTVILANHHCEGLDAIRHRNRLVISAAAEVLGINELIEIE